MEDGDEETMDEMRNRDWEVEAEALAFAETDAAEYDEQILGLNVHDCIQHGGRGGGRDKKEEEELEDADEV